MVSKIVFDIFFSYSGIIFLSPVCIFISCLIKMNIGSPILFRQVRLGLNGKPFKIYKFRTMTNDCDKNGKLLPDALRITKLGCLLRNSSFDELPELFNVLKGDMSIVGPRPLLMQYLNRYTSEQARRHEVKPGLTGWAQINGRNAISWEEKFKLDVWYVDNHNIWLDLKIIARTIVKVFHREGISHQGEATMSEFMGTEE